MLLAIDTATRFVSIALYNGVEILAEQTWQSLNQHTEQLAPAVYHMMERAEIEMDELTGLGISTGPGSYTGLRIGIALAKGFATALNVPLVGVTTLDTLASSQPYYQSGGGLVVAVQAGRGRVIARSYRWRKGEWTSRTDPRIVRWESLPEHIDGPAFVTGEIDTEGQEILRAAQEQGVPLTIVPAAHRVRRAGYLAQLAWDRLAASDAPEREYHPSQVMPVYLQSEETQPPQRPSKSTAARSKVTKSQADSVTESAAGTGTSEQEEPEA